MSRWTGPRVDTAVDIILFDSSTLRVCLGRKFKHADDKWTFPGGFADPRDTCLYYTALRETREELGWNLQGHICKYMGCFNIPDPRYSQSEDRVFSHVFLFCVPYQEQQTVAGDDLDAAQWYDAKDVAGILIPHHQQVWRTVQDWMNSEYLPGGQSPIRGMEVPS